MSATPDSAGRSGRELTEEEVVEYLLDRRDFFTRNPDLVASLDVPHGLAGAASLVEYRASRLKEETETLEQRLQSLLDNARVNEELSERLHRLALKLMDADRLDELLGGIYSSLRDEFGMDFTSVKLIGRPRATADVVLGEVLAQGSEESEQIGILAADGAPRCGVFDRVLLELIFGDRHAEIRSAAIFSLGTKVGVMGLGSVDAERFRAGMGTLFLRRLAELVAGAARAHLASD